jgi:hypothetical protein
LREEWILESTYVRVVVNVVDRRDNDRIFRNLVSAWQDEVCLCCASRLERGVVSALRLLDVLIEERELLRDICGELCVLVDAVVDKLLQQAFLHSWVGH